MTPFTPRLNFYQIPKPKKRRSGLSWTERTALRYDKKMFPSRMRLIGMLMAPLCFFIAGIMTIITAEMIEDVLIHSTSFSYHETSFLLVLIVFSLLLTILGILGTGARGNRSSKMETACSYISYAIILITLCAGSMVIAWCFFPNDYAQGYYQSGYATPQPIWRQMYAIIMFLIIMLSCFSIVVFYVVRFLMLIVHIPFDFHWRAFIVMTLLGISLIVLLGFVILTVLWIDGANNTGFGNFMIFFLIAFIISGLYLGTLLLFGLLTLFYLNMYFQTLRFLYSYKTLQAILATPNRNKPHQRQHDQSPTWKENRVILPQFMQTPPPLIQLKKNSENQTDSSTGYYAR